MKGNIISFWLWNVHVDVASLTLWMLINYFNAVEKFWCLNFVVPLSFLMGRKPLNPKKFHTWNPLSQITLRLPGEHDLPSYSSKNSSPYRVQYPLRRICRTSEYEKTEFGNIMAYVAMEYDKTNTIRMIKKNTRSIICNTKRKPLKVGTVNPTGKMYQVYPKITIH